MKCQHFVAALGAVCLLASPGRAQPGRQPVEDLQRQIEILQQKLQSLEAAEIENRRVTQLGAGTRLSGREPEMVVRIYDLGDLFALAPPYPAQHTSDLGAVGRPLFPSVPAQPVGAGMGGMGGGMFNVKQQPSLPSEPSRRVLRQFYAGVNTGDTRSSIDDVIEAITSTISPTQWIDVGGPASITSLGNSLLISADERTHKQIDDLITLFRKRWGTLRTVSVRADWLWLTAAQLQPLLSAVENRPPKEDQVTAYGLVDEAAWARLLEELRADDQRRPGYQAVLTCYNGQTVHAVSGGQSLAVTGMVPVVGSGPGYQPQVSIIQEGAALQVTPIVNVSGKFVLLDVHSRLVERLDDAQAARPAAQPGQKQKRTSPLDVAAAIDRPQLATHRFSTTLRMPVDRRMLVGGMTYQSVPGPGDPNLYLFLKLSVQELRDDQAEPKPDVPAKPQPKKKPVKP